MSPTVNKPTDVKKRDADVGRKLQFYGIASAFKAGKVPSNDQVDVALNTLLEHKALSSPSDKLSPDGQALVADARDVILQAKNLLLSKNEGNLLQDFTWQTREFDPKTVVVPGVPIDKATVKQHGNEALEGLRTLGTLIITNGQFRKMLNDVVILLRDIAGDAATSAASRVRPSDEKLAQIDQAAEENTWHDAPDLSKGNLKKQMKGAYGGKPKDGVEAIPPAANDATKPDGTNAPKVTNPKASLMAVKGTLQKRYTEKVSEENRAKLKARNEEYRTKTRDYINKKMPKERKEQTIWRLKKMVVECQQHPEYSRAIQTLLDLAGQYGSHGRVAVKGGSGAAKESRTRLAQAENDIKSLIERFANGTSTDPLWSSIGQLYKDAETDEELNGWFKSMDSFIRRCLLEQGYIVDDASTKEWDRLYKHGRYLLREKYRAHTDRAVNEIKLVSGQFDKDPQNKAFAKSVQKLFTDLGNDENGKPAFKPHLFKDLRDVILPACFENVAYIPIPRIEFQDAQFDVIIENLVLESDNFMPNLLSVESAHYFKWGRKDISNKTRQQVEVKVAGVQMDLRGVSYHIKRKQGFPSISDTGIVDVFLGGDGFSFKMKMSTPDAKDSQNIMKADKVDVDFKNLKIKLVKSKYKILFNMFQPILLKVLRPVIQKVVEKAIKDQVNRLDAALHQVKQEADRAKGEVHEDPKQAPNVYKRYYTAVQKRILQCKEKAKEKKEAGGEKKVNLAITKEESIFPDIELPGGTSTKATEYKEMARKGDKWESPVFSIGSASKSTNIPPAPKVEKKSYVALTNGLDGATNSNGTTTTKYANQITEQAFASTY